MSREPKNASMLDAHIDGAAAARAQEARRVPGHFTPRAAGAWLDAYDDVVKRFGSTLTILAKDDEEAQS